MRPFQSALLSLPSSALLSPSPSSPQGFEGVRAGYVQLKFRAPVDLRTTSVYPNTVNAPPKALH